MSSLDDELCTFCTCQSCHAGGCAQVGVNYAIKTDDHVVYFKSFDIELLTQFKP
jgi:Fe-S-cluster-containing hydrogenase component 2